jgi:hypothetical protein
MDFLFYGFGIDETPSMDFEDFDLEDFDYYKVIMIEYLFITSCSILIYPILKKTELRI